MTPWARSTCGRSARHRQVEPRRPDAAVDVGVRRADGQGTDKLVPGSVVVVRYLDTKVEIQRGNPACEVMLVSVATDASDVVHLTEVWSSTEEWENARSSDKIRAWAASMPGLVDGPPETEPLEVVGGKGLRHSLTGPTERGAT